MGRSVWFHEIWNFVCRDRRLRHGPRLGDFWGAPPQDADEEALSARAGVRRVAQRADIGRRVSA